MNRQVKADLSLVVVALFWGSSVLLTKIGLRGIPEFTLIALRFVIAFALTSLIFWKKWKEINFQVVQYAMILGGLLFLVFIFMTYGVKDTTVSHAGFLTCLAGVFIPIITFGITRKRPETKVIVSVCLAFIGVALLCLKGSLGINRGDWLCILCSLAFAVQIMVTGNFTRKVDPITLSVLQLGFVGLFSTAASFIFETPKLPETLPAWLPVLALSLFCTAAAYVIQNVAQKYTTPTHTGLILSLEPVFAAFSAFFFAGEVLSVKGYIGAVLLVSGIFLVEIDFKSRRRH